MPFSGSPAEECFVESVYQSSNSLQCVEMCNGSGDGGDLKLGTFSSCIGFECLSIT